MSVPQDQRPAPGHHARAVLYEAGVSGIGVDNAAELRPHEVRKHGVRQLGKRATQVALGTALVVGLAAGAIKVGGEAIDYELDRVDPTKSGQETGEMTPESLRTEVGLPPETGGSAPEADVHAPGSPEGS